MDEVKMYQTPWGQYVLTEYCGFYLDANGDFIKNHGFVRDMPLANKIAKSKEVTFLKSVQPIGLYAFLLPLIVRGNSFN